MEFIDVACAGQPLLRDQVLKLLSTFDNRTVTEVDSVPVMPVSPNMRPGNVFEGTSRFAVLRQLGFGAFGTVYHVWDHEQKVTLAAKVLHRRDPKTLMRFKHEFRSMVELHHQNLVRLNELFCEGEQWFFTMELVEGESFLKYVRPGSG